MSTQATDNLYDLAIIGMGPVGLLAANFFGQMGWRVLAIERHSHPVDFPRAIHLDTEAVRLLQMVALSAKMWSQLKPSSGLELRNIHNRLLLKGQLAGLSGYGSNSYLFFQPTLEQCLREGCKRFAQVTLREGLLLQEIEQEGEVVSLIAHDTQGLKHLLRARYVLGCDGANSTVRQLIGRPLVRLPYQRVNLKVDAILSDRLHSQEDPTQGAVQKFCHPTRAWVRMAGIAGHRRWEFTLSKTQQQETADPAAQALALLQTLRVETQDLTLLHVAQYRFEGSFCTRWQNNRVFLAGDAAHTTPPYIGQGMCAGFRDIANLSWKLQAVHTQQADKALLQTYTSERLPHAIKHTSLAILVGLLFTTPLYRVLELLQFWPWAKRKLHTLPIPFERLGAGFWGKGKARRQLFPQWRDESGALSDDFLGQGWSLVCMEGNCTEKIVQEAARLGVIVWVASQPAEIAIKKALNQWVKRQKAVYFLLRPDKYVYASGKNAAQVWAQYPLKNNN
ncbi:bifunctional 3-(3-hydroxy-phenyl)propionate/3-hydroxycinnamic acid hydroxylase [Eisenibacter elegans]|uniref:bifunctional 3-(3-hydroxy-phenyl)propionate/3-hydroxycinnamic acid hydroxylase n=1 Tax=Eisenibacter elegans TaxID=997 RepID=UPI00042448E5|nr:bifunctional 3-(3-hydroxy-phenyl)propionate/3-hydroxycinnamic acid hydroxylase [Eisenibacter elegans]